MVPATLDDLNDAQLAAVGHTGGPLLVLGAAGTGKTRVLAQRFAWLSRERGGPDGLVAVCASTGAASDLRAVIDPLVAPPYERLEVGTFESLCAHTLREEALEAGLDPGFTTVTPAGRVALLLEHLDELTLRQHDIRGNPVPLLAAFVARIDTLRRELIGAGELTGHAERHQAQIGSGDDAARAQAARELEFAGVYTVHDRLLTERRALDEGGLVARACELLLERPHVRERVVERLAHLLVDDYQDATFAHTTLLGLLGESGLPITVAADPDQTIARFRCAGVKNVEDFERAFTGTEVLRLEQGHRCPPAVAAAAKAVLGTDDAELQGREGDIRFWRCASERAQAQAVAAEIERRIADGSPPDAIAVLVGAIGEDAPKIAGALEERAIPFRVGGPAAYFQRAEVRDVLAWLRVLADPGDSGAAVRALTRPPIELQSVDIARLTQLARRRKVDIPTAVTAALEGPQLTPEGRDRAQTFLRLYRAAANAFEDRSPDRFVLRLIERIGVRRQQVFATHPDTVERLRNIARLPELAADFVRREPQASARDFARYLQAVADCGLPEHEAGPVAGLPAVRVMERAAAKSLEVDHAFVIGLDAQRMPGPAPAGDGVPNGLLKERLPERTDHELAMRRLMNVAMTRARGGLVLAWAEGPDGLAAHPSPFYDTARAALDAEEENVEEELFGPAEGMHSAFRLMRDELLDSVARVGGRLGEMRLDAGADVSHAVARYLELIKVAALIDRAKAGQALEEAVAEVNALLAQGISIEQREALEQSSLDDWLADAARDTARRPATEGAPAPSLDPFIPRRRGAGSEGLMLSASDIETYRICPLKYKFARVFRIPQDPTIYQRFGIVVHQVLERFHRYSGGRREELMDLFESSWRKAGFGDSDDEQQFHARAVEALERYWRLSSEDPAKPVWFERSFSFTLDGHLLRGRVDRVDRRPNGTHELLDYKTGRAKSEQELREDVQLSIYQMGARESWGLETSAQSYMYVMSGERVPVAHSEEELERVRATVSEIGAGIARQQFEPKPSTEICPLCDYRIVCPAAER